MSIPSQLRIGAHTVRVIFKELEENAYAEWDGYKNIIYIDPRMSQTGQEAAFVHEVFHVLNSTMDNSELGHILIDSLAEQFYQVLKDNPISFHERTGYSSE